MAAMAKYRMNESADIFALIHISPILPMLEKKPLPQNERFMKIYQ